MKRVNLSKALYEIGKLTFAALVLGQFFSPVGFNVGVFIGGVIFFIIAFAFAYIIDRDNKETDR